jgi:hypothetical protein
MLGKDVQVIKSPCSSSHSAMHLTGEEGGFVNALADVLLELFSK